MGKDAARRTRLPVGLAGMLALVIGVETLIALRARETVDASSLQYREARQSAGRNARDCEVLGFGDSLLKYSFLPRVLESRHGLRGYNLAVCGGQSPYHYYLLHDVLAAGARPSTVLIEFYPPALSTGPRLNATLLPHYLTVGECLELGWSARDPALLGELLAGRLFPSVRCRSAVLDGIVRLVRRAPNGARFESAWILPFWAKERGAQPMHAASFAPLPAAHWQPIGFPVGWRSDPVSDVYLDRFLSLAARNGITVCWVLTPLNPSLQAECERVGFDARYLDYIRDWQRRFDNLVVIDGRHAAYDPNVYASDPIHLGRDGAFVFSTDLGAVLRRRVSGAETGRWTTLPRYRKLTVDRDIEDDMAARLSLMAHPALLR
jgi:hypothetical protein